MDKARAAHVAEMERLEDAMRRTKSQKLRRDYAKAWNRMKTELREYDSYRKLSLES